jgi:putative SOS response-associated peptidase YedK
LSACRLEQIRRSLLRATQWHAANYAATDKMQQVGQTTKLQKIRWLQIYAASQCPAIIALITTDAKRALVVDIRDRMPVILATRDYARWLGDEPDPGNLMQPFPANSILESVELAQE